MPFFCSKPTSTLSYPDKKPQSVYAYPPSLTSSLLFSLPHSTALILTFPRLCDCAGNSPTSGPLCLPVPHPETPCPGVNTALFRQIPQVSCSQQCSPWPPDSQSEPLCQLHGGLYSTTLHSCHLNVSRYPIVMRLLSPSLQDLCLFPADSLVSSPRRAQ